MMRIYKEYRRRKTYSGEICDILPHRVLKNNYFESENNKGTFGIRHRKILQNCSDKLKFICFDLRWLLDDIFVGSRFPNPGDFIFSPKKGLPSLERVCSGVFEF